MGRCDTGGTSTIAPTWSPTLRRLRADFLVSLLYFSFYRPDKSLPGLYPPSGPRVAQHPFSPFDFRLSAIISLLAQVFVLKAGKVVSGVNRNKPKDLGIWTRGSFFPMVLGLCPSVALGNQSSKKRIERDGQKDDFWGLDSGIPR